ncbi:hypothetical protein QE152_g30741 [Popillia japonica]|uniref:Uncharacterized protein n=1 Tax=Popillia japonica TaxID=7064 RepID=A0AAW1JDX5_POPJA
MCETGVGCFIKKEYLKYVRNWTAVSERILKVEMELEEAMKTTIITVYGPNEDEQASIKDEFWDQLTEITERSEGRLLIIGDLNGRVDSPSYRIFLQNDNDVISSENVIFDEKLEIEKGYTKVQVHINENHENILEEIHGNDVSSDTICSNRKCTPKSTDFVLEDEIENLSTAMIGEVQDIPISKALQDERWSKAMSEEFESLIKMKTWDLEKVPERVKPLTGLRQCPKNLSL